MNPLTLRVALAAALILCTPVGLRAADAPTAAPAADTSPVSAEPTAAPTTTPAPAPAPAPITLPNGMSIELELQQHVNSAYVPTGAPIYFRVAKDIRIQDQVLVRAGTLVTGKMQLAAKRGRVGKSGSMSLGVDFVDAVDGTHVPIDADLAKQGRSRTGATVAWTLFWGIPGLITQGVNPYLEKGTVVSGQVVADTRVDVSRALPAPPALPPPVEPATLHVVKHKFASSSAAVLKFDIERNADLKTVSFEMQAADVAAGRALDGLALVAVDGVALPEPLVPASIEGTKVTFDGWSVVRYLHDGESRLRFRAPPPTPDAAPLDGTYAVTIKVEKKG